MDPTKVIYAAAASSSLDSWDFENLHYIRKISKTNPHRNDHSSQELLDAVSYISEQNEEGLEAISLPFLQLGEEDEEDDDGRSGGRNHGTVPLSGHVPAGDLGGAGEDERADSAAGVANYEWAEGEGSGRGIPLLDDCYLLDVVTVRNESVLAFTSQALPHCCLLHDKMIDSVSPPSSPAPPTPPLPPPPDSDSGSSRASVPFQQRFLVPHPGALELDHVMEPGDVDFFDTSIETRSLDSEASVVPNLVRRRHSRCGKFHPPPRNTTAGGTGEEIGRTAKTIIRPGNPWLFSEPAAQCCDSSRGEPLNLESVSMEVTVGEDAAAVPPRSPSPYYVRLRRDLLAAITPPPRSFKVSRPRNFMVNTDGQLAIDYSSNWLGLENYVRNKRR